MRSFVIGASVAAFTLFASTANSRSEIARETLEQDARAIEQRMIEWRRDIHAHPELGNHETRTSALVAQHLKALGYEVRENIAKTGVVALLHGDHPGPVLALRSELDALPVQEELDLPFASRERANWLGREVGVMHACGHDAHIAILLAAATLFASRKSELHGSVKLIFQPAEEGLPPGEKGGAQLMIEEGALENPRPDAIVALHAFSFLHTGMIMYGAGAVMAASDRFRVSVRGKQTHGAQPWSGTDPIVLSSQIILGLQTIASRQVDVTRYPVVITVGTINGGTRPNIIPDRIEFSGTLRTLDIKQREFVMGRIGTTAAGIARSGGGEADIQWDNPYLLTVNQEGLVRRMAPSLEKAVGRSNLVQAIPQTTSEDFAYYAQQIPALFFFIGCTPPDVATDGAAPNHSPKFYLDERSLIVGLRAMLYITFDFLSKQ